MCSNSGTIIGEKQKCVSTKNLGKKNYPMIIRIVNGRIELQHSSGFDKDYYRFVYKLSPLPVRICSYMQD